MILQIFCVEQFLFLAAGRALLLLLSILMTNEYRSAVSKYDLTTYQIIPSGRRTRKKIRKIAELYEFRFQLHLFRETEKVTGRQADRLTQTALRK
jgi:hypothetical protein